MSILIKGVEFLQGDLPLKLYVWSDGQAEVRNYDGSSTAAEAVSVTDENQHTVKSEWQEAPFSGEFGERWVCPICNHHEIYRPNFCANCGADMRAE